jgi:cation:H+ antiporter
MEALFIFVSGATLLIYSAEKLIKHLVGIASGLNISLFLLAIVFAGIEFDDVFLGVALNLEDLDGVALGTVFGAALSLVGIVLALAAILTPTEVRVPKDYLALFVAAPLGMFAFALTAPLGAAHGAVLLGLFALFITYVAIRESRGEKPVFRDAEMYEAYTTVQHAGKRSGWAGLGFATFSIGGLIVGSATTGVGTRGILETYGLDGTLFGATIATLVLTIEDVFLTVEPARKGAPEIGVGNVIGSVVFSVTGKLGIILLTGGLVVGQHVLSWHLPALVVLTVIAAYFLSTGRLRRWHGFVLLGLYAVYWIVSFGAFDEVAVDLD